MCHNGAFAVWFLHSKKGGKIQTGLNCEVDSLSKACLWLAYSNPFCCETNGYFDVSICSGCKSEQSNMRLFLNQVCNEKSECKINPI